MIISIGVSVEIAHKVAHMQVAFTAYWELGSCIPDIVSIVDLYCSGTPTAAYTVPTTLSFSTMFFLTIIFDSPTSAFSIKSFTTVIAGDSLVSLVLALKANPKMQIFFPVTVPKSFLTIKLEILC